MGAENAIALAPHTVLLISREDAERDGIRRRGRDGVRLVYLGADARVPEA